MDRITGSFVDIPGRRIFPAEVIIRNGKIETIRHIDDPAEGFILPGFIDAHVHVESSMLLPSEFARVAVTHGTVATISDPHEIANVLGVAGVDHMIENGSEVPFHFFFGAPSCVPATEFETAGARIDAEDVRELLARPEILYLSEMMNFPGVLNGDPEVMKKIAAAKAVGKPIDGHAPGLLGSDAARYAGTGISTDHECSTIDEARDKLAAGMWILIREGSAARNFDALVPLLRDHSDRIMFCSDDKHPDSLVEGHINTLCARAIKHGIDLFNVLQAACINPILHYRLPIGRMRIGDPADFIVVKDLKEFAHHSTFIKGRLVALEGRSLIGKVPSATPNNFNCSRIRSADLEVRADSSTVLAIEAFDGQLITGKRNCDADLKNGILHPSIQNDVLKIVVVNRYADAPPAIGWITNFKLKHGAIASSVAHDSHNIVAVGTNDEELAAAINAVIDARGGICTSNGADQRILPLPVAGIMSDRDAYDVAQDYADLDRAAKELGSELRAPFMTLSFMALLVIPHLKMSDLGLFDGDAFRLMG